MARSRRNLNDSRPQSPSDDDQESSDEKSVQDMPRGRSGKQTQSDKMDVGA
jgi:choline-phosphate cytidylyltransferase